MASPFSIFRKNQKLFMAVACLLAIVAFVFLPFIMDKMGTQTVVNPVVVETSKFGDLRERDVAALRSQRQQILGVLTDALQIMGVGPNQARLGLEAMIGPASEASVVNTWLLAKSAEQMGMVISNEMVNSFLAELTQNMVKPDVFLAAFRRSGISEKQFFEVMRNELAARQLRQLFNISMAGITPAQRWEYFSRVKQTATIEAVAVPVANYLSRIDDPDDAELKAFFEEHKNQYARSDSPEPGFHEPQKISLEYFQADAEKFRAPDIVTDDEVKQHYEKNKELYEQLEKKLAEEKEKIEGKESTSDTKEAKPTKEPEAKDVKTPPESSDAKEPAKTKEPEKEKKANDTSAAGRQSPFVLTALLQDAKTTEEKPAEKTEAKAADVKSAEKTEAKAAEEKPTEKTEAKTAVEKPADAKSGPSEITKDRIRREIAQEKIKKIFDRLREPLDEYRRQWSKYEVAMIQSKGKKEENQAQKSLPTAPTKPDFEKLAKQYGLSAGRTGLISQSETAALGIGASLVGGRDWVAAYAFQTLARFRPEESQDLSGDRYLFWKTEETKDRIPEFGDPGVRERVLHEWKMIRARKLAVEAAKALADEAAKAKKPLKQAFADRPDLRVVLPPPFSWITFGNVPLGSAPSAARLSAVTGVDFAGEDFMRTVFHLKPEETGVAMNAPQTVAYVIQPTEFTPSHAVLWKQFEIDDFRKYAPAGQADEQRTYQAWLDEIKSSAGFKWMRKADRMAESGPSEGD